VLGFGLGTTPLGINIKYEEVKMKNLLFCLILLCLSATSNNTFSQSLFGSWDKTSGPGDPIKYDFLSNNIVLIYFPTRIDTADYTTFLIPSSDLRGIDLGQNGVVGWRGIYIISSNSSVLQIEGYWYTGLPTTSTPTSFSTPTTYSKVATTIKDNEIDMPKSFLLLQNYPNPFNPSTTIEYSLPGNSFVSLKVYDVMGKEITILVNKEQPQGNYKINFDGSNLSSGIYLYRLHSNTFIQTRKFVLLK